MATSAGIADTICAVVLLVAGGIKVSRLYSFGQQIVAYQILPRRLAHVLGYALPPAEIALGLSMLFVPRLAVAAAVLFISFAVAVGVNLVRGRTELRCGCFGPTGKHTISAAHVAVNFCLALLAAVTFIEPRRPTFAAFQVGLSAVLLVLLASAWRTIGATPGPDG